MSFGPVFEIMASLIFAGYLVWASWQDLREMQVIRYTHILGGFAIGILLFLQQNKIWEQWDKYLEAIFLLFLLQVLAKWQMLYGMADMIVFFLSGLFFLMRMGTERYLLAYFLLQALSGIGLLAIQAWKHNIKGLKLGCSVPYIPYICVAFILTNMVL